MICSLDALMFFLLKVFVLVNEKSSQRKNPLSSFSQRIEEKREKWYNISTFLGFISLRLPLASSGKIISIPETERDNPLLIKVDQKLTNEKR